MDDTIIFSAVSSGASSQSQDGTIHTLETESAKEERYLGVLIDNQLSFKSHVLSKVTKVNQMTRIYQVLKYRRRRTDLIQC